MKTKYILTIFFFLSLTFISCRKEGQTIAIITIQNSNGTPESDAQVIMYGVPNPNYGELIRKDTLLTDSNGKAVFDYTGIFKLGQEGFAILEIKVNKGLLSGVGTIRVNGEKTSHKTITIYP